jgi:hypothetical protein
MFYDVLMEKRAQKEKRKRATPNRAQDAVKGVGIGAAGAAGGLGLAGASRYAKAKAVKPNRADMIDVLNQMGSTWRGSDWPSGDHELNEWFDLPAKDGRTLGVQIGGGKKGSREAFYSNRFRNKTRRGDIVLDHGSMDRDLFFHELGHATGEGSKSKYQKPYQRLRGITNRKGFLAAEMLGGLGAAGLAGSARNKREADRANMAANTVLGLSAVRHLPTLAEEARATIRAHGLSKKFTGKGVSFRKLAPAYGTYLGAALAQSAPGIAAKVMAKRKQRQFNKEQKD